MDFEDFIKNRTDSTPQDIFKKLGSAALLYLSTSHNDVPRTSLISTALRYDHIEPIENLNRRLIRNLCTASVYAKAKIFECRTSKLISTNVDRRANTIEGEFRSALIYDQSIRWGISSEESRFSLETILVYCTCKYYNKETVVHGLCCKHIIGQLRRVIYLS